MSRLDRVAARLEPPFPPEVAELIEWLDQIALEDEREPDADFEPWLGSSISGAHGGMSDLEFDEPDSSVNVPFELDQSASLT